MKNYIFLFLLFSFTNSFAGMFTFQDSSSTVKNDSSLADENFDKAKQFLISAKFDSSNFYFEKALLIYGSLKNWKKYITCHNVMGDNHLGKGEFDKAKYYYEKADEIGKEKLGDDQIYKARTLNNLGRVYRLTGFYEKALNNFEKSLSILIQSLGEHHNYVGLQTVNIGNVFFDKGNFDKALEYYRKALPIYRDNFGENHYRVASVLMNIGSAFNYKEDYFEALDYHKKALSIRIPSLGNEHTEVGNCYINIGFVHKKTGNYSDALEYYNKALSIYVKSLGKNHNQVGNIYLNIGGVFEAIGDFDKALEYYKKSFKIYTESYGINHPNVAMYYNNSGILYKHKHDYKRANQFYQKALSIRRELFGNNHPDLATSYINIGNLYNIQKEYTSALRNYQLAFISLIPEFREEDIYTNPNLENILSESHLLEALSYKAEVLEKLYTEKSENIEDLVLSIETDQLASNLIDKIKSGYNAEDSKFNLSKRSSEIYENALQRTLKLYELTNKLRYKKLLFTFIEKNKAGILLESLTESRAKQFSGIPDSLLKKEKELRVDLAFYDTEINKEKQKKETQDSSKIIRFEDKYFDLNEEYQELLSKFEKDYPQYYNMKYKSEVISVRDIQERLDDDEVLLEYFLGDSTLFIFTIDKNNYNIYSGIPPKNSTIKKLNNSIYNQDKDKYLESSYSLYSQLIEPVEEKIKEKQVLIIPDGILHYIPFETLLTEEVKEVSNMDYSNLPYLINDYSIKYAYSATMAFSNDYQTIPSMSSEGFLGFAPVFADSTIEVDLIRREVSIIDTFNNDIYRSMKRSLLNEEGNFNPLPASEEEVKKIYKMFKEKNKPAEIYIHSNATEEVIKSDKPNKFKYIHLATHAFMNEKNPKLSGIVLSSDSKETEDGVLYSEEIYNLDLNADLVVLSACESGLGEIVRGEGIIGFTRGLMFSGAKNIIVSMWNVADRSTSKFMTELYSRILEGKKYSEALRQTKLNFIKSDMYSEPFYWGAFNLVGN